MREIEFTYRDLPIALKVHDDDYISNSIALTKTFFEVEILESIRRSFPKHRRIIDIGANIGNHAVFFRNFLQCEDIVCFEPFPANVRLLAQNVPKDPSLPPVHVVNAGLSDSRFRAGIRFNPSNLGICVIDPNLPGDLDVYRLDDLKLENITLIKSDVEESHLAVIRGALETIKRSKPMLVVEGNFIELAEIILPLGYACVATWGKYDTYCFLPLGHGSYPLKITRDGESA